MKLKKILMFTLVFLIAGCSYKSGNKSIIDENTDVREESENKDNSEEFNYNKINLGLYFNDGQNKVLISDYSPVWRKLSELISLEVYLSDDKTLNGSSQKDLWYSYYNLYKDKNIDNYKIGFQIEFDCGDDHIKDIIVKPDDTLKKHCNFIQTYLYDDINNSEQSFYSHLTNEDYSDNTVISSIKLVAGTYYESISSDVILTVFIYKDDELDKNGYYNGVNKYSLVIKR